MKSWLVVAVAWGSSGCVPSRAELFDPVRASIAQRTGIEADWRDGRQPGAAAEQRIHTLLAQPMTAEGAAAIAVLNNPGLQASYERLAAAGARTAAARTPPNPEADVEVRFPLDGQDTQVELRASESLTRLLALVPRGAAAGAELRAERQHAVAVTVALAARAKTAYFEVAAAEQRLALRRTIAEAATASEVLARSLHEAGNLNDLAFTRETVTAEDARLEAQEAEAALAQARERLNGVLGLHGDETSWRLPDAPLPDPPATAPDVGNLEPEAVAASLELEAARGHLEAAGEEIGAARLESFFPDVGIGVSAKRESGWGVGPALRLSLPLFDWGQGRRAAAWAQLRGRQHEYANSAVELRAAARATAARLGAAHACAVRIKQTVLPLRQELQKQAVLQYNAMNLSPFELLVIRRETARAQERYVDALLEYWTANVSVEALRAGALPAEEQIR